MKSHSYLSLLKFAMPLPRSHFGAIAASPSPIPRVPTETLIPKHAGSVSNLWELETLHTIQFLYRKFWFLTQFWECLDTCQKLPRVARASTTPPAPAPLLIPTPLVIMIIIINRSNWLQWLKWISISYDFQYQEKLVLIKFSQQHTCFTHKKWNATTEFENSECLKHFNVNKH